MLWQNTFGGVNSESGQGLQQTEDGGYILFGSTQSFGEGYNDFYLVKTDEQGTLEWQRYFGGSNDEIGFDLQLTNDGGYALIGETFSAGAGFSDVYLVKTDALGTSLWQRTFGGDGTDVGSSLRQTTDGGYIITGWTQPWEVGEKDVLLLKTDSGGGPMDLTFNLNPQSLPITIPAGGGSFSFEPAIINNGPVRAPVVLWSRIKYPTSTLTAPLLGPIVINLPVGMTINAQRIQSIPASWPPGTYFYYGYISWVVCYPAAVTDSFPFTKSAATDGSPWVMDSSCTSADFGAAETTLMTHNSALITSLTPNPFNPTSVASYELRVSSHVSLRVYDTAGRLVSTLADGWQEAGTHSATFDGSKLAAGVYLVKLEAGGEVQVSKIVLLK
jgi:hypothetical protein